MEPPRQHAIAVIGMGCRLPGAASPEEFWRNLLANRDSVTPVPPDRFDVFAHLAPEPGTPGKTVSAEGGFVDRPFAFDAAFFGISPAEARTIDPQQRLLLYVVWEALESAGIKPSSLAGSRTGVFIGQATAEYAEHGEGAPPLTEHGIRRTVGSRLRAMSSGRVSFALDLRGPSLVLDTACSSSLVAVHTARQSLLAGESDLAVAGGVNLVLSPTDAIAYSQAAMLSPRGRCRFGDESADGFVRSEGVGVVLLKRLADAERDGDEILALIQGSAVTNDGQGSGLLLKPAVSGQVAMIQEACRSAGIEPGDLDYVEAHGTGTSVGDPVELTALSEALAGARDPGRPLLTGSVKSNIGHAEAAAGIAGLIKAVLMVRHNLAPASLHVDNPHAVLRRDDCPVQLVTQNRRLKADEAGGEVGDRDGDGGGGGAGTRTLIGVSSFGLSGTNAHAIVSSHSSRPTAPAVDGPGSGAPHLLVLSARSERSLRLLADAYARHLGVGGAGRGQELSAVCAAAALRRDHHPHRLWVTGSSHDELAARLAALAEGRQLAEGGFGWAGFGGARRTVFVFPGQGSQWRGMGRRLLETFPAFRASLRECDAAIRAELGWSVLDLLDNTAADDPFPERIDVVQPALWAMEVSMAALWRDCGVEPDACIGHSMGESAAAQVVDALSLTDAAAVICRRSRLMSRLAGRGAMLATELAPLDAERVVQAEQGRVCVAAVNSPRSTVLAGDPERLRAIHERLERSGTFSRFVRVTVASHSPDMDELRAELLAALADLRPRATAVPLLSTVHAGGLPGTALDAEYWMDNLRRPVRFADAVAFAAKEAESVFLEISPHPLLATAMEESLSAFGAADRVVASAHRGSDEQADFVRALGRLYALGARVDWRRWFRGAVPPVPLPHYAWDAEDLRDTPDAASELVREYPLDEQCAPVTFRGMSLVPPMLFVQALLRAAEECLPGRYRAEQIVLGPGPIALAEAVGAVLRVSLRADGDHHRAEVWLRRADGSDHDHDHDPVLRLSARVVACADHAPEPDLAVLDAVFSRCSAFVSAADFQQAADDRGYGIPPELAAVKQVWRRSGEAVARLRLPDPAHPAAWEALLQVLIAAAPDSRAWEADTSAWLPSSFGRVEIRRPESLGQSLWAWATVHETQTDEIGCAAVTVCEDGGRIVAQLSGIKLRRSTGRRDTALDPLRVLAGRAQRRIKRLTQFTEFRAPVSTVRPGRIPRPTRAATPPTVAVRAPVPAGARAGSPPSAPSPAASSPALASARDRASASSAGEALLAQAALVLGVRPERLDPRRSLRDLGMDSIAATRLRRQLTAFGADVSMTSLLGSRSIGHLIAELEAGAGEVGRTSR